MENKKFPRSERLRSRKVIGSLFDRNSKETELLQAYPFRAVVRREPETAPAYPEIMISVPKRNFKKAVDRNRIKRLTREAYRRQKALLPRKTYIAFLYQGKDLPALAEVQKAMGILLNKIR